MNSAQLQGRRCCGAASHAPLRRGALPALGRVRAAPEQHHEGAAPGPSHLSHRAAPAAPLPLEPESAPLRISRRIAAARAVESRRQQLGSSSSSSSSGSSEAPLFVDPYAELLAAGRAPAGVSAAEVATDVIATAYTDELLLRAVGLTAVNDITEGDYRQVVLLGDALDTRPYRLPWPPGTALYLVAPREAHAVAEAALASEAAAAIAAAVAAESTVAAPTSAEEPAASASTAAPASGPGAVASASTAAPAAGAKARAGVRQAAKRPAGPRPPPGCLLRRVSVDLRPPPGGGAPDLLGPLTAAGFRGERLSVWGLQGIAGLELDQQDVAALLAEAANAAAYHSLLLGELPAELGAGQAANAIAEAGLMGAPLAVGTEDTSYGRWQAEWGPPENAEQPQRWVFASQQVRLSIAQMDTYSDHGAAAAELDEDFFDNFS